jgi:hypothetical protein
MSVPGGIGANRSGSRRLSRFAPPTPPWVRRAPREEVKDRMTISRSAAVHYNEPAASRSPLSRARHDPSRIARQTVHSRIPALSVCERYFVLKCLPSPAFANWLTSRTEGGIAVATDVQVPRILKEGEVKRLETRRVARVPEAWPLLLRNLSGCSGVR